MTDGDAEIDLLRTQIDLLKGKLQSMEYRLLEIKGASSTFKRINVSHAKDCLLELKKFNFKKLLKDLNSFLTKTWNE